MVLRLSMPPSATVSELHAKLEELTGIPPMPKGKAQIEVRFGRVSDATHGPPHRSPRSSRYR